MPLFTRRTALPPAVRSSLGLRRGDSVLAATRITGGWAVASRLALHVTSAGAPAGSEVARRRWADVDVARLDSETDTLTIGWVDGTVQEVHLLDADQPAFARTVHERVQSSIVHAVTVPLPRGGGQVRVALRRDENGDLFSQVTGKGPVDLTDPAVAALVDAAEARVRGAAGLPQ